MESKYDFRMTQKAEMDLDHIVSYIAVELSNPKAATDFMDKLQGVIDEACEFPQSGSPVDNEFLPINEIRKKIVGNYVLYYFPEDSEKVILVLRVVYGKRNMNEILKRLEI